MFHHFFFPHVLFHCERLFESKRVKRMRDLTGKPAINFELLDSNGKLHQLSDDMGSWLLLVFHRHLG